jgi:hypothetical protein
MTAIPTLDPEIADLGLAVGVLESGDNGVELDSSWFNDPGGRIADVLAVDARRAALMRFLEALLAGGSHTVRDGVTLIPIVDVRKLSGDSSLPNVVVQLTVDDRPADHVEIGIAAQVTTTQPATTTDVEIPLFRAAKTGHSVAQPFALLDGGVVRLASDIELQTTPPAADEFGLAGVSVAVAVALAGGPPPSFQLQLKGLQLPGAAAASDLTIGDPNVPIVDSLLSLVLGLVRQAAEGMAGGASAEVKAVLDLVGLGDSTAIPMLPVEQVLAQGAAALQSWLHALMTTPAARTAWLGAIGDLLGGTASGDQVDIPIGSGPVSARVGVAVVTGPDGHMRVTPQLGLSVGADVAGSIHLGVEASADVFTLDADRGTIDVLPRVDVAVTTAGNGSGPAAKLLHTTPLDVGSLRLGLSVRAGAVNPLLELLDVDFEGTPHAVVDLSSPDAVAAAAGQLAGDLLASALDALGASGADLKALLGLDPPGGVAAIDATHLLTDPLGALAAWWLTLLQSHASDVPTVLGHLRDLVAEASVVAVPITGAGTPASPWSIKVARFVTIDSWLDGTRLVVAPTLSLRVDDLAGGCTVVETDLRLHLAELDLAAKHATFLSSIEASTALRARGASEARLALGPVAIVADSIGLRAGWTVAGGFAVDFAAPNLGIDTGAAQIPLVLPTIDGAGNLTVAADAWGGVETLFAVLGANSPHSWLADLVDLAGWTVTGTSTRPHLALGELVTNTSTALTDWLTALVTDSDALGSILAAAARLTSGARAGLSGIFTGSGTPDEPWRAGLGTGAGAPSIVVWLGPSGPVVAATQAGDAIRAWLPGAAGLPPAGLARALFDDARAAADVAALAAGRDSLGAGLDALRTRWLATDGLVAAPPAPIDGLTIVNEPDLPASQLPGLRLELLLDGPLPAGAAVVRVAVGAVHDLPWTPPSPARVLDLTTPNVSPSSFTVDAPDAGEWYVALAPRADASLGAGDPSGVAGQAARLVQVLTLLASGRPVVLVAYGGTGHAARLAADAVAGVTHLVTLGTPWSAATFDTARTGAPADALRLLAALLPAVDESEPDDADLALGRALVGGFMQAARGAGAVTELEAPRPTIGVRVGLTAVGVFGALTEPAIDRALTAVVAAGLSGRAQARAEAASAQPASAVVALRVPVALLTPPGGHGTTVAGSIDVQLASATLTPELEFSAAPALTVALEVADTDAWLVGGPGTTPVGGALPMELRRVSARIDVGLHGGPSHARIVLHEGAALGATWDQLVVEPPATPTGDLEAQPLLPEAQAVLAALTTRLHDVAVTGSPAAALFALLEAAGWSQADGSLVPNAVTHLLHDPGAHIRTVIGVAPGRDALLAALAGLVPGVTATGAQLHAVLGPCTIDGDIEHGTVAVSASGNEGLVAWRLSVGYTPGAAPSFEVDLGDLTTDAFGLAVRNGPWRADLTRAHGNVALFPTLDIGGLGRFVASAVPAEALRLVLEGLRSVDLGVGTILDDLCAALGLLGPPDGSGHRAVRAPVALFDDPGAWFTRAGVLTTSDGGPLQLNSLVDLLEAVKPFVGLSGTPHGTWPIVAGIDVAVAASAAGPTITLGIDPTVWLAGDGGRAPFAAGLRAGVALQTGAAPTPTVEVYLGVPEEGGATPQHRRAVHVVIDATGLLVFLRPATGADVELAPHPAGLGAILAAGVDEVLPFALNQLATMSGDAVRDEIAALVGGVGRGLAVASGTPAVFDSTALHALAADPVAYLRAHLTTFLGEVVDALDPVMQRLLGLGPSQHVAAMSGQMLTITVRTAVIHVQPSPFVVTVEVSVTGLPVVGGVALGVAAGETGLDGWSIEIGPAIIDLAGPVVRPLLRAGRATPGGWSAELGLALDALGPTDDGHHELFARWREAEGDVTLVASARSGSSTNEDTTPEGVALAAITAVIDLVGGWVLGVDDVKTMLGTAVGSSTVRAILTGPILDPAAPVDAPRLVPGALEGWPGKLLTLAVNLAGAKPTVTIDQFQLGLTSNAGVLGVSLDTTNAAGIDVSGSGEFSLRIEADASWIDPPSGTPPAPGIVVDLLRVSGETITPAPGIELNGVGVRLGKQAGPLIDAGLRLDAVAVYLFGSVVLGVSDTLELAGGIELELEGLAVPLGAGGGDNAVAQGVMHDAGGSGAPPRPAFSPAIAVQSHGQGVEVTLRAGSGDGPWFLPIQRAFGPVYLEQIGLGTTYVASVTPRQLETISILLDGSVSLLGLIASVDKLRLGYHVSRPFFDPSSWEVDVDGFAIAADISGLSLAGGLRKVPLESPLQGVEYLGMLKVAFGSYGLDVFGGYAHPTTADGQGFASFFAFGVLHAPIGGPPAFFVTGIGLGFGINRELEAPDITNVNKHPFMQALRALGPPIDPMVQLEAMREIVKPAQGQYWVAAGISFTSFVLITGEIVVTVQFGDGLDIAILGLARAELPAPELTLVSIELALLARFSTKEGLLLVQAQLTENSWLLDKSVRLIGGFAFETWWKGPNAGQFVVTVGGYHPRFHHDRYPVVPRVGLTWQPADFISVKGGVYFALCSEALMAGVGIEVAAHIGPAHARLAFGGDAIVFFDPFWFSVEVYAEVDVGITIWLLFGSVDLELSFGVDVKVEGPPIFVTGHFSVMGVGIPFEFGDQSNPADKALTNVEFAQKYLRGDKDAQVVQAAVIRGALVAGKASGSDGGGQDKPPDGSVDHPFRVAPEFQLTMVSTAPAEQLVLARDGESKSASVPAPDLGVAPMYSATLDTTLTLTLASVEPQPFTLQFVTLGARPPAAFPKGVWGEAPNPNAPRVPEGETVNASDGLTVDTVLPESMFTGAPPIDYHQIELPLNRQRKPLPFVTNKANTDARVTESAQLKDAAAFLEAGDPNTSVRFEHAARLLAAGGTGASTVAALRGERVAAPRFGSLADDLVVTPAAVSPIVTPVVVERNPPPKARYAPLVQAVLGAPLAQQLGAAAGTSVADTTGTVASAAPTFGSVRSATLGVGPLALAVQPPIAAQSGRTVSAVGTPPVTRLSSGPVGAVANASPAPPATARLATMSDALVGTGASPGPARADASEGGAALHEGELAVITVPTRPRGDVPDTLTVTGGTTRVLALAAGGKVLDDRVMGADGANAAVEVPRATERVVVVAEGPDAAVGGALAGWYGGQSLPTIGWGIALAGGAVVHAQGSRMGWNRERADGGWALARELVTAAQVVTTFADPVDAVAVIIDDAAGTDAAATVSMRLLDAERVLDAKGDPAAPQVLIDGVRTILLYAVAATGPEPAVLVDGCGQGHLGGVVGGVAGVAALAAVLTAAGVEAAVLPVLAGGPGIRQIAWTLGDGPIAGQGPRMVAPRRPTKRAPGKKQPGKKQPGKKQPAKKPRGN